MDKTNRSYTALTVLIRFCNFINFIRRKRIKPERFLFHYKNSLISKKTTSLFTFGFHSLFPLYSLSVFTFDFQFSLHISGFQVPPMVFSSYFPFSLPEVKTGNGKEKPEVEVENHKWERKTGNKR